MQHILDHVALLRDRADLVLGGDFNVAVGYRQPRDPFSKSSARFQNLTLVSLRPIHGAYGEGFEENKIAMKQNRVETTQPANGVGR